MGDQKKKRLNKKTGHAIWVRGVDMPEFSGKSWKELNDIWPANKRVTSDVWHLLGLIFPAMAQLQRFMKVNFNTILGPQDILLLAFIMRCEEAKSNVGTELMPIARGVNLSKPLTQIRIANLIKTGLVETFPAQVRLYRLTEMGRLVLRQLVDGMEQAHADLLQCIAEQPDYGVERVNEFLKNYCFIASESALPRGSRSKPEDSAK